MNVEDVPWILSFECRDIEGISDNLRVQLPKQWTRAYKKNDSKKTDFEVARAVLDGLYLRQFLQ